MFFWLCHLKGTKVFFIDFFSSLFIFFLFSEIEISSDTSARESVSQFKKPPLRKEIT